jgi:uncharacterized membrane protein YkoI
MRAFDIPTLLAGATLLLAAQACSDSATAPTGEAPPPAVAPGNGTSSATAVANANPPFGASRAPASANALSSDSAAARVRSIVPSARIIATRTDEENGIATWKVTASLPSGARLSFELLQANGIVISVEGEVGPFTYDLEPGNGIASFANAMAAALRAQAGSIVKWELELDDSDRRWEYEFYIRDAQGGVWEVELDARTLRVLDREARGRNDDDASDDADDDDDKDDVMWGVSLPDSLRQRAIAMVTGATLSEVETEREHGLHLWKLKFRASSGLKIELRLLVGDGTLIEAEGDDQPTLGNVTPGDGLLDLATARTRALSARAGELEEWTLSRTRQGSMVWRFEIEAGEEDYVVRVDAKSGAVTVSRDDD